MTQELFPGLAVIYPHLAVGASGLVGKVKTVCSKHKKRSAFLMRTDRFEGILRLKMMWDSVGY